MKLKRIAVILSFILIFSMEYSFGDDGSPSIEISPVSQNALLNGTFTVEVIISSPIPILAAQFDILYNASIINAIRVLNGGAFEIWGDDISPMIEIDNINGSIRNIVALSPNGTYGGVIARIEFKGINEGSSFLNISNIIIGDEDTIPVGVDVINGSVTVTENPWDVNMDGTVDILDMIIVAQHWMETPSSPNWYERADVNGDEVVNILDLIVVAQHFS